MNQNEIADLIERFLNGTGDEWEWDDFISMRLTDPGLESIRVRCAKLPLEFPPSRPNEYCGDDGRIVLKQLVKMLRA